MAQIKTKFITNNAVTAAKLGSGAATSAQALFADGSGNAAYRSILAGDIPTLNQNTTGTAANVTASSNSTLTTLSALSLPGSQVTGNIAGNAANVTGVVALVHGGTGIAAASANDAFNALSPMTTAGDIIYEDASPAAARLGIGSSGQVLTVSGGLPVWATPSVSPSGIALTSAHILVGNGSNVAADVAMSGEASISNTGSVTLSNAAVIAKVLTGYVSGAGTVSASDSILSAIQKLNGNAVLLSATVGHLNTLSGVAANADDLGSFTGAIIPDASDIKEALQSLESFLEAMPSPFFYAGTWAASTNTPTLDNTDTGKNGYVYYVTDSGTVDFGAGPMVFNAGDKVANNGATWDKWDMTDSVVSVNGQSGVVSLALDDLTDVVAPSPSTNDVLTWNGSNWINSPTAATLTVIEQHPTLSGTDITNQYFDLAHVASGVSAASNSISLSVVGGPEQLKGVDYTVGLTGGAGGVTRITFAGDLATGGPAALVASDILMIKYAY